MKRHFEHYKPNIVYELLIHGVYHYGGCHCSDRDYLTYSDILNSSGNYYKQCLRNNLITHEEYHDICELYRYEEFDTKQDALNREVEWIKELREQYGPLCINHYDGNKIAALGFKHTEETKRKQSIERQQRYSAKPELKDQIRKKVNENYITKPDIVERISKTCKENMNKVKDAFINNNPQNLGWNDFQKYYKSQNIGVKKS